MKYPLPGPILQPTTKGPRVCWSPQETSTLHYPQLISRRNSVACGATLAIVFLLSSAFAISLDDKDDKPKEADIAAAGKLFKSSCAMCHLPPDPGHPTDRAWLNQVKDTA